jgi:hypothetical protein
MDVCSLQRKEKNTTISTVTLTCHISACIDYHKYKCPLELLNSIYNLGILRYGTWKIQRGLPWAAYLCPHPWHGTREFYPQVSSYPETKCITMFHADTAIRPSWVYFITSDQIPKKSSINILPEQVT